ncbi:MAG: acetyl-CoA carboxylase carboxyl transferase subunit alpha, partial [candidate division Zixibacteria bacterium]|nr:acetyl-CoA carboxylase carboxyl transferase subunit alpha [candidate division Zixibacteria bacterium]
MLEYSWYSVISPEGCAAILWRDAAKASEAAEALKPTADDLIALKVVDDVIPEPDTGAHSDPAKAAANVKAVLVKAMNELKDIPVPELLEQRLNKYRNMGVFKE